MITFLIIKMVRGYEPSYLQTIVPPTVHQVSQRNLRNDLNLVVPRARTNFYNKSFITQATREWNSLPTEAKNCNSIPAFKRFLDQNMKSVPNYFYVGNRKAQILHTRLRLHCSSLNSDLHNNHITDNNRCSCGEIENAEHFLLNCLNYTDIRNSTIERLTVPYNIETLLTGCPLFSEAVNREIFLAVQNFILKTQRFD